MPGDLHDRIANMLAPLQRELERIDAEQARLDQQTAALREERKTVMRMLNAANPNTKPGRKPANSKPRSGGNVGADKVDALEAYLRRHYSNGDEFVSAELREEDDFAQEVGITYTTGVTQALNMLHERGVIRLVREGKFKDRPGARTKIWKLAK